MTHKAYWCLLSIVIGLSFLGGAIYIHVDQKRIEEHWRAVAAEQQKGRQPTPEEIAMIDASKAHTKESRTKVLDMIIPAYAEPLDAADAKLSRNFQVLDDAWAREIQERQALEKRIAKLERKIKGVK